MTMCKENEYIYTFETRHFCLNSERNEVKVKNGSAMHLTLTLTLQSS